MILNSDFYRELAKNTQLNDCFRTLFSEITVAEDFSLLHEKLKGIRDALIEAQHQMVQNFRESDLSNVPIYLVLDKSSSSGTTFLRWRSYLKRGTASTGYDLVYSCIADAAISDELRSQLVAAENERALVNAQVSLVNYAMRQIADVINKTQEAKIKLTKSL